MAHMQRPIGIGRGMLYYHLLIHPSGPGVVCQGLLQHFIQELLIHEEVEIGAQDLHPVHVAPILRQGLMDLYGYGGRALFEGGSQAKGD